MQFVNNVSSFVLGSAYSIYFVISTDFQLLALNNGFAYYEYHSHTHAHGGSSAAQLESCIVLIKLTCHSIGLCTTMHMTDKLCKCSMHCVRNEYYCRIQITVLMKFMILGTSISFTQSTSFVRMVICGCVGFS